MIHTDYPRLPWSTCYSSAQLLAPCYPELTYAEGVVTISSAHGEDDTVSHAWRVRDDGVVVDPTLRPEEGETFEYLQGQAGHGPSRVLYLADLSVIAEKVAGLPPGARRRAIEDCAADVVAAMFGGGQR